MITKTTIKLSDLELEVYQLEDGSYVSEGLFRLMDTVIYRYQGVWYWLGSSVPSTLRSCSVWHWDKEAILTLDGNRLCYLLLDPVDPEGSLYDYHVEMSHVPVPNKLSSIIEFCIQSRILSDDAMLRLLKTRDLCYSGDSFNRAINRHLLLRDTGNDLHRVNASIHFTKQPSS
jgi:hypothetical protein